MEQQRTANYTISKCVKQVSVLVWVLFSLYLPGLWVSCWTVWETFSSTPHKLYNYMVYMRREMINVASMYLKDLPINGVNWCDLIAIT